MKPAALTCGNWDAERRFLFVAMTPVLGAVLSALLLDEKIQEWKTAATLGRVCLRIWRVTQEEKPATATD